MADAKPKTKKMPGLRVRALTAGFRRAGRAWNNEFTEVAASDFTKMQIEQLRSDPQIVVEDCDIEVAAE